MEELSFTDEKDVFETSIVEEVKRMGFNGDVNFREIDGKYVMIPTTEETCSAPVITLDSAFDEFLKGSKDIIQRASLAILYFNERQFTPEELKDSAKNAVLRIMNEKMASFRDCVSLQCADLVAYPVIPIKGTVVTVNKMMLEDIGYSETELIRIAKNNMRGLIVKSVSDIIREATGVCVKSTNMYAITTATYDNGAAAIMFKDVMDEARSVIGGNFYIIPSSVHEILAIPQSDDISVDGLKKMCMEVNEEIDPRDVLSDSVYLYDGAIHRVR